MCTCVYVSVFECMCMCVYVCESVYVHVSECVCLRKGEGIDSQTKIFQVCHYLSLDTGNKYWF